MGIAALIIGILSIIIAIIPFCGMIALLPAIIGLVLGIIDVVKKSKSEGKKGMGIAGIILTSLSIAFCFLWGGAATTLETEEQTDTIDTSSPVISSKEEVISPSETTPTSQYDIEITGIELINAYKTNEIKADNMYKGKKVKITGKIDGFGKDFLDNAYIKISDGEQYSINAVQCYFSSKSEENKAAEMNEKDEIILIGTVGTFDGLDLVVNNCKIIK